MSIRDKQDAPQIAILGAGNIGMAIAEGITRARLSRGKVILTRHTHRFSDDEFTSFDCTADNKKAVSTSDIIILAVQPKQVDDVLTEIKSVLTAGKLLISVASGVSISRMEKLIGEVHIDRVTPREDKVSIPIARAMPNTAIRVEQSMTCLAFNEEGRNHKNAVEAIFRAVGQTLMISEEKFAEATGLCGSGTAFGLKYVRGYMQACIQHGFNEEDALMIASQVVKGSAMIVQSGGRHPEVEIDRVTTPDGCTIAGLVEMDHAGFISALLRGISVCIGKARELYS